MLPEADLSELKTDEPPPDSELPQDNGASQPITEAELSHPTEKDHFARLYLPSCSFGSYPKLVTISEGRNEDRPGNRKLHS